VPRAQGACRVHYKRRCNYTLEHARRSIDGIMRMCACIIQATHQAEVNYWICETTQVVYSPASQALRYYGACMLIDSNNLSYSRLANRLQYQETYSRR
jgi:hypothetical protein